MPSRNKSPYISHHFLRLLYDHCRLELGELRMTPRRLFASVIFPYPEQVAQDWLDELIRRNWYDYGATIDLGWLTSRGEHYALLSQDVKKIS